ncbi:MAG: hypothetical protein J3K34DRAFT_518795 [Monoraphidium minutum]|nr:MAG: hypothetical protein J3K34DRAFT_518795 [Monoraphidium minutum]
MSSAREAAAGRGLPVCEVLTREVLIIHHTDCGAQAAERHIDLLMWRAQQLLGAAARLAVSAPLRRWGVRALARTFSDPAAAVEWDVAALRAAPLMRANVPIHGLVYDVATGRLSHVTSSPAKKYHYMRRALDQTAAAAGLLSMPPPPALLAVPALLVTTLAATAALTTAALAVSAAHAARGAAAVGGGRRQRPAARAWMLWAGAALVAEKSTADAAATLAAVDPAVRSLIRLATRGAVDAAAAGFVIPISNGGGKFRYVDFGAALAARHAAARRARGEGESEAPPPDAFADVEPWWPWHGGEGGGGAAPPLAAGPASSDKTFGSLLAAGAPPRAPRRDTANVRDQDAVDDPPDPQALKVGDSLKDSPEFYRVLKASDGSIVSLAMFVQEKKQPLVLFFYPKAGTPGCTKEACKFRDEYARFTDAGAVVFGVSSDSPAENKAFADAQRLPFLLLTDPSSIMRKTFGIPNDLLFLPGRQTYVFDAAGKCVLSFNSQLDAEKHVDEALAAIKAIKPVSA